MAHKAYNRNASSLDDKPPAPSYAETLLYARAFKFQSRQFEDKIDLRRISKVDIDRIVKDVDLAEIQSLLENLVYAQISEDDFDLYSSKSKFCMRQSTRGVYKLTHFAAFYLSV